MLTTSARLLRLLSLLQSRSDWSGAELADRLEVAPRTVRRDVDRLRELGYPVLARAGTPGYRLGMGANVPPLLLDDEEAVAVALGLRTAMGGSVTGIEESSVRALAKLEQVLPSRLRRQVNALQSMTVPMAGGGPTVDPSTLSTLAAACRDSTRMRFDYRTHSGDTSVRSTEPHRLIHSGRRWYLIGWDVDRADWRTYRVDRLTPRTPGGPRFQPRTPPDIDLSGHTSRGISTSPYRYQARFTLQVSAEVAAERIAPTTGVLQPIDEHSCTLVAGSNSLDDLAIYVVTTGFAFRVHEPPELAAHLRVLAARLADAADLPGPG